MSVGGMQSAAAKAFGGPRKMEWNVPKDKKEFVGFLAGARRETRERMKIEFINRYGIRILNHIGHEHERELNTFIPSNTEVVIVVADDIQDGQLTRVLKCAKVLGLTPIGIDRKKERVWDTILRGNGYHNPPKWRDGGLIENPADPDKLEAERLAELAALETPRQAYVDPKLQLVGGAKLGDKLLPRMAEAEAVVNKYIPPKVAPMPAPKGKNEEKRIQRGDGQGFGQKTSPKGWPEEIRKLREATGLQQNAFARKYGFGQSNISTWELGKSVPTYVQLLKLREIFPGISEPPGVRGKKIYEQRAKEAAEKAEAKQAAKDARAAAKAPPVVEPAKAKGKAPASPPPVVTTPAVRPQDPAQFAEKVIRSMGQEELLTVNLRSGGSITLMASVQLMKLKGSDRKFVFDIIDALQAYEEKKE